jgi:hypothetical protein
MARPKKTAVATEGQILVKAHPSATGDFFDPEQEGEKHIGQDPLAVTKTVRVIKWLREEQIFEVSAEEESGDNQ